MARGFVWEKVPYGKVLKPLLLWGHSGPLSRSSSGTSCGLCGLWGCIAQEAYIDRRPLPCGSCPAICLLNPSYMTVVWSYQPILFFFHKVSPFNVQPQVLSIASCLASSSSCQRSPSAGLVQEQAMVSVFEDPLHWGVRSIDWRSSLAVSCRAMCLLNPRWL